MKFTVDKQEHFTVFALLDEKLNSVVAPELKTELIGLNTIGVKNIILDLTKLKFIDSSGLSAILIGNRLCQNAEGSMVLTNANEYVMKLMRISQLENILTVLPSVQEAKDYIKMEVLEKEITKEGTAEDNAEVLDSESE